MRLGFIDLPASPLWLAHEYPQINPGPEPLVAHPKSSLVKLHYPIRHPPTMTMEEAQTYWRTVHGPLVRSIVRSRRDLALHPGPPLRVPAGGGSCGTSRGTEVEPYTGHAEAWSDRSVPRQVPRPRRGASGLCGRSPLHRLRPVHLLGWQGTRPDRPLVLRGAPAAGRGSEIA